MIWKNPMKLKLRKNFHGSIWIEEISPEEDYGELEDSCDEDEKEEE